MRRSALPLATGGTQERDYSGGGLSALRVISSPPESGGVPEGRGGLNARFSFLSLGFCPFPSDNCDARRMQCGKLAWPMLNRCSQSH